MKYKTNRIQQYKSGAGGWKHQYVPEVIEAPEGLKWGSYFSTPEDIERTKNRVGNNEFSQYHEILGATE